MAESKQFRFIVRASAIAFNDAGSILLCKFDKLSFWMLPGGKVEKNEVSSEALRRELQEELGVIAEVGPLLGVIENFFTCGDVSIQELGLYFEGEIPPHLQRVTEFAGAEAGLVVRWFAPADLTDTDVRPAPLKRFLQSRTSARFGYL